MLYLGVDVGSSSVKVSLLDGVSGKSLSSAQYPENELTIEAPQSGWAEQDPQTWWECTVLATKKVLQDSGCDTAQIKGIGISYQMHGLVVVDKNFDVLRPAIIWCDSRAVSFGDKAFNEIGKEKCLVENLNSPGNFTASKLAWVKENQPEIYSKIYKIMLPGDFIALKLSGVCTTTATGMSEGVFWNFKDRQLSEQIFEYYGLEKSFIPDIVPAIGDQVTVNKTAATELGIPEGVKVSYRAGDQPNNAFSLNVLNPGEVAATAGTSAVVYAITDKDAYDENSRVNTFLHVNNTEQEKRNGVLLCINGSGIYYQWIRKVLGAGGTLPDYSALNDLSSGVTPGAGGLMSFPFGNGAERILQNKEINASILGLNFNMHSPGHMVRAAKEGIVFAMNYGFDVMAEMNLKSEIVRAGKANLFLSPVFRDIFVNTTGTILELYETNGAEGAARGAALGTGFYKNSSEAFSGLNCLLKQEPDSKLQSLYSEIYASWKDQLQKLLV